MYLPDVLGTSRVRLRRLQPSDGPGLHAAATSAHDLDPSVERIESIAAANALIAAYARQFALGARFVYGVFDGDTLVGCAAIQPTDVGACNLGLWLAGAARGRGLGSATIAVLAAAALRWLGVERVELWCEPANRAMVRVAERLGFTWEATLRRWVHGRDQMIWRLERTPDVEITAAEVSGDPVWSAIGAHLRTRYAVVAETAHAIAIAVDVAFATGRSFVHHVVVECGAVARSPWLMIRTPIGREDLLAPRAALLHSATLAAGAVALEDDHYVLRYGLAPELVDGARLDTIVHMLAHEAVRLRELDVADPGAVAQAFAAFTD
jgi:RimJ/RimL family protein N-acetyltransferase